MSRFSRSAGSRPPGRVDASRPARHPALVTKPSSRGDLGDEIRRRRKARNLTQKDLAKLAAVATTNIGKVERGLPVSATTIRAIARALDLPDEMTAPFLSESASDSPGRDATSSGLSDAERALIRALNRRGWPAEDIADAIDELRRSSGDLPTVSSPSETDRARNVSNADYSRETGA